MSNNEILLSPLDTPAFQLRNRIVMAPMSRRRAENGIPGVTTSTYYGQRTGAGLIIAENTAVTANGIGYLNAPAIYNSPQKAAWKEVVAEVHAKNGKIFLQLVHTGRIGHHLNHEDQAPLVAPSAVTAIESIRTPLDRYFPMPEPQILTPAEIKALVGAYIGAAVAAREVGFDGVEIHGAHGFLPEQFLHPYTNQRTDEYGGNLINRCRFLLEVMEGVATAIGKERTGLRLSPFATLNDLPGYAEEAVTHQYIIDAMDGLDICYIHLSDLSSNGLPPIPLAFINDVRIRFKNILILAGGFTFESATSALLSGIADLIAFGRPFIANPDLVERFRRKAPLAIADTATYYEGGDKGYIDYPAIFP